MPLYEYRCKQCGHKFEKIQSFSAADEKECPVCKGEVERLISVSAIQFKGSGWYASDYASKASKAAAKAEESGGGSEKPAAAPSDGSGASNAAAPSPAPAASAPAAPSTAASSTAKGE